MVENEKLTVDLKCRLSESQSAALEQLAAANDAGAAETLRSLIPSDRDLRRAVISFLADRPRGAPPISGGEAIQELICLGFRQAMIEAGLSARYLCSLSLSAMPSEYLNFVEALTFAVGPGADHGDGPKFYLAVVPADSQAARMGFDDGKILLPIHWCLGKAGLFEPL